ncbi:MAG: DNA mismatch repair protein [SAR324 cluster bacterium]|uniref:DNA mismatch repair protein MutL n=1 Tax=SAR324 cluster bacterium TaxID=2024889 RepID=A0A2A4T633_9DELT|nr:MAG: DNA mismatch repair protein [SAR324 cluster bacterium]
MPKVKILSESLINKIAAGEVVERPASVVKELVENAIDAQADQIFVTIKNGGKDSISVLDNGCGMNAEDAKLAIERHATSKISTHEDLDCINTMGFRGEALAAISAVSRFELTTCCDEKEGGFQLRIAGGKLIHQAKVGFPVGTRFTIENLFFNTPARQKFMKSASTEYNHVYDLVIRLALGHPNIQFRLTHNKTMVLNIPKGQDFRQRVEHCFGNEIAGDLIECEHKESYLSFTGLISPPSKSRASKRWQHTFVNERYVKCNTINHGIYEAYKTLLMKNMHPMFFMNVTLMPQELDVNVHPAKTEIRVKNPTLIHTILSDQLSRLLRAGDRKQFFQPGKVSGSPKQAERKLEGAAPVNRGSVTASVPSSKPVVPLFENVNEQMGFVPPIAQSQFPQKNKKKFSPPEMVAPLPREQAVENPFSFAKREDVFGDDKETSHFEQAYSPYQVIGQLQKKYILAQGEESLILVDQHAAHERIRFEEIRKEFYSQSMATLPLMIPIMLELPPQDGLLLEQHQDSWEKLGFTIDHFGGNDYSIKEVPAILKDADISQVIRQVLDEMAQFGKSGKLEIFYNEVFERMACHSAIRAAQILSIKEMQSLLNQLAGLDLDLYCPHGRPVLIEISVNELDKRFRRIL